MVMTDNNPENRQVGGDHYKLFAIQPYQFCFKNKLNNLQSEVISYVARYDKKWPGNKEKQLEDLEKAIHSIELLIKEEGLREPEIRASISAIVEVDPVTKQPLFIDRFLK